MGTTGSREALADLLRQSWIGTGKTQRQLALDLGIGLTALSRLLAGRGVFPSKPRLEQIASRMGCLPEAREIRERFLEARRRQRYRSPGFIGGDGI